MKNEVKARSLPMKKNSKTWKFRQFLVHFLHFIERKLILISVQKYAKQLDVVSLNAYPQNMIQNYIKRSKLEIFSIF